MHSSTASDSSPGTRASTRATSWERCAASPMSETLPRKADARGDHEQPRRPEPHLAAADEVVDAADDGRGGEGEGVAADDVPRLLGPARRIRIELEAEQQPERAGADPGEPHPS